MKKLVFLFIVIFAVVAIAQDYKAADEALWYRMTAKDWWMVRQAGYAINTWDSVTTAAVWSEPFRSWDFQSVICHMIKDSVRVYAEYWAGVDTNRATMVYGRTLEWDKAAALDSTYVSSTGYWNCNVTEEPVPVHPWARLKFTPGASGSRKIKDDSLFTIYITGRK